MTPSVSVVTAVYDGAAYVRKALDSILNQTFSDFEFIVVDDGSRDRTWDLLEETRCSDARIVLFRNAKNEGLLAALNRGVAHARGEYLARMDADDISDLTRLQKQVACLRRHPEVDLLGTGYERRYSDGRTTCFITRG